MERKLRGGEIDEVEGKVGDDNTAGEDDDVRGPVNTYRDVVEDVRGICLASKDTCSGTKLREREDTESLL